MSRVRTSPTQRRPLNSCQPTSSQIARRVVPGTGGMTPEELYAYRVRAAAALLLSLIEEGVIQPNKGQTAERETP